MTKTSFTPQIKICGLRTVDECRMISRMPIDYVGLVLTPSRRQVTISQAKLMQSALRSDLKTVGVFTSETPRQILDAAKALKLAAVQIHHLPNLKTLAWLAAFLPDNCQIWQRLAVELHADQTQRLHAVRQQLARWQPKDRLPDAFLIDSALPDQPGGTGRAFNLDGFAAIRFRRPLVLAGGLNSENVAAAIRRLHPAIVDCSSGVEAAGRKCETKVLAFCQAVQSIQKG